MGQDVPRPCHHSAASQGRVPRPGPGAKAISGRSLKPSALMWGQEVWTEAVTWTNCMSPQEYQMRLGVVTRVG